MRKAPPQGNISQKKKRREKRTPTEKKAPEELARRKARRGAEKKKPKKTSTHWHLPKEHIGGTAIISRMLASQTKDLEKKKKGSLKGRAR